MSARKHANVAYTKLRAMRPFRDQEAWFLFRLGAFGEAIGWTLLGTGVTFRAQSWPGNEWLLPIAGRLHGTLFIAYIVITLATWTSLRWRLWLLPIGLAASVVPYGTLVIELLDAHRRKQSARCNLYAIWLLEHVKAERT